MFNTFPFFRVEASVDAPAAARTTGAAKDIKWADLNLPRMIWNRDRNLLLMIAVIAMVIDFVRVLPLTISNLALGAEPTGLALVVGTADFLMAGFLLLAHPTLGSFLAILLGSIAGIVMQATTGCPAMSGWLAMCLPWAIVNRKQFALSKKERIALVVAAFIILVGWSLLVWSGHVVPPEMQLIGWFYTAESVAPEDIKPFDVIEYQTEVFGINWPILDRVERRNGEYLYLDADDNNMKTVKAWQKTSELVRPKKVFSTWSPRRMYRGFCQTGRWRNHLELQYPPRRVYWHKDHVLVFDQSELVVTDLIGNKLEYIYDSRTCTISIVRH